MFKRKKPHSVSSTPSNEKALASSTPQLTTEMVQELSARCASLFMICYRRGDISGMHIVLTAFTHTLYGLKLWSEVADISGMILGYILLEGFPKSEEKAVQWLLNHYFDQVNEQDESCLLNWYQALDDEWVLRKKLRELFPGKPNSELTLYIAAEHNKPPSIKADSLINDDF